MRLAGFVAALAVLTPAAAWAADSECGYGLNVEASKLGIARVVHPEDGRAHFRDSKAFLVAGDEVVAGGVRGDYVCVWFKPKGRQTSGGTIGWLRRDAISAPVTPPPPPIGRWSGTWVRDQNGFSGAEVKVSAGKAPGTLHFEGIATYAGSREDIKRGNVHDGEVDETVSVRGALAGLDLLTPAKREALSDDCHIGVTILGDYLMVTDNGVCGGLNVSFDGLYRRTQ